jgi:D-alanyl-D-alanine carboxypeptidase
VRRKVLPVWTALLVVACGTATPSAAPTQPATATPAAVTPQPTPSAKSLGEACSAEVFGAIPSTPVSADLAAELQSALDAAAAGAGGSATLMSPGGTWTGTTGTADGVRPVTTDTQFSIASTTKAITAAQVMQVVEAGQLGLDDLVADHLPPDIDFDANGATIRDLLGHRSGIPDYAEILGPKFEAEPRRFWTPAELLAAVPDTRTPAGGESEYANINYVLLGLALEQLTGKPMVDVLRHGVLAIDGVDRLIYQPAEAPSEPFAIDGGRPIEWFESMGGFLPSYALTSDGPAAAMASDSVSLARWWRAFCAGEIVSEASLREMLPKDEWYGLGLGTFIPGHVGHFG